MNNKTKVALYLRSSHKDLTHLLTTSLNQLVTFCNAHDKEIVEIFVDEACSSKILDRPSLQKLLMRSTDRAFDEVVTTAISRIARKSDDLLKIVDLLHKNNIAIVSISPSMNTKSEQGVFILSMLGSRQDYERQVLSENRTFKKWNPKPVEQLL